MHGKKINAWKCSTLCLTCSMKLVSFHVHLVSKTKQRKIVVDKSSYFLLCAKNRWYCIFIQNTVKKKPNFYFSGSTLIGQPISKNLTVLAETRDIFMVAKETLFSIASIQLWVTLCLVCGLKNMSLCYNCHSCSNVSLW